MLQHDKICSKLPGWILLAATITAAGLIAVFAFPGYGLLIGNHRQVTLIICATLLAIALLAAALITIWMLSGLARQRLVLEHTEKLEMLRAEAMRASRPHHQLLIAESIKNLLQALGSRYPDDGTIKNEIAKTFSALNNAIDKNELPADGAR